MWNPFRRRQNPDTPFPKPKWPPIQNLDSVDITALRNDGGVDLVIVASQPLDDSPHTLHCICQKITTYLDTIEIEEFQAEMNYPPREKTVIIIRCDHSVHSSAQETIEECKKNALKRGIRLEMGKIKLKTG